jgi:SAM-dependent methyltransferase
MWWRRVLTIPHVVRAARRARSAPGDGWDGFWSGVTATGDGGDVLWDASTSDEIDRYRELLDAYSDPRLPLADIGCGNGRFTRALAGRFPRAVGVDVSPAAVARAQFETNSGQPRVSFRVLDVTEPGAGNVLRDQLGEDAIVFLRGVLHVLSPSARRQVASSTATLAGDRGVVLVAETQHRGSRLGYLERLGAGPRGIPPALRRLVASGLPAPLAFGEAELDECFPLRSWHRLMVDPDAVIMTVPSRPTGQGHALPGFVAVLTPRHAGTAEG